MRRAGTCGGEPGWQEKKAAAGGGGVPATAKGQLSVPAEAMPEAALPV